MRWVEAHIHAQKKEDIELVTLHRLVNTLQRIHTPIWFASSLPFVYSLDSGNLLYKIIDLRLKLHTHTLTPLGCPLHSSRPIPPYK